MIKRILLSALAAVTLVQCPCLAGPALAGPVVLFDEGHRQQFLAGRAGDLDLSRLAAAFAEAGLTVRTTTAPLDGASLRGVTALVISGAFAPLAPAEVEAVREFVAAGGRLALMLHITPPAEGLLVRLGISYSLGPIHEAENLIGGRSTDFTVVRFERHPVTEGLHGMGAFGCWGLKTADPQARVIARTGDGAWLDTNGDKRRTPGEPVGSVGVVVAGTVGAGAYVVFGDDAIFQNRFIAEHNAELARRLASWSAAGAAPPPGAAPAPGPAPAPAPTRRKGAATTEL